MPLQNFVDKVGPTVSALWLNAVDTLKFTVFADATTKAQARTNLTSDAPLEVANGGTGVRTLSALTTELITTSGMGFGVEVSTAISGAIVDLGVYATTHVAAVTGIASTVISSFGSNASLAAPIYLVRFTDYYNLAHNAVSMILPGGVNITTMAGDSCIAEYMGGANWRVLSYQSNAPYPKFVNTTNSNHTIQSYDLDNVVMHTDANPYLYAFPSDIALAITRNGIGREVDIFNNGTGLITLGAGIGATFTGYYGTANVYIPQYASTKVRKTAANTWVETTPSEISYNSTSYIATISGTVGPITGTLLVEKLVNVVTISTQAVTAITATSNAVTMTVSAVPAIFRPNSTRHVFCVVEDNGALVGGLAVIGTNGIITFGLGINGTSFFTNSGIKGLPAGWSISYPL